MLCWDDTDLDFDWECGSGMGDWLAEAATRGDEDAQYELARQYCAPGFKERDRYDINLYHYAITYIDLFQYSSVYNPTLLLLLYM
jgi:hypothetical protein